MIERGQERNTSPAIPGREDVLAAARRIAPYVHRTPVMTSRALDFMSEAKVFFKCENFQKAGSFKIRGATNAVLALTAAEVARGVATHSSGNHGAALALAARNRGVPAYVVMPEDAPRIKQATIKSYGAEITFCKPSMESRQSTIKEVLDQTGASLIHPFNNPNVVAGQGTVALELVEEVPDLDLVLAPVGGGGLVSGTALALEGVPVVGVEPEIADDARRSLETGEIIPSTYPPTVADGLRTSLGELTFTIIRQRVGTIVTVSEEAIISAMRTIWERMKIVVEPSSAVTLAALLTKRRSLRGNRIGAILSGGNVDLDRLPWAR